MKQKKIFGFDYTYNEYMKIFMYLLVGGSAALLEWGLFFLFCTSTLYHYFLCNRFVFDSGSRYHKGTEVSLVFLVSAVGLGWNLLLMWIFTSPMLLGLNPMLSKIMASAIVTVWNYLSRKKWIFK